MTDAKIDINQANEETLAALPGVGRAKARRIIEYRETVQPFTEIMELTAVKGITERIVHRFEDQLTVEATIPASTQLGVAPEDDELPADETETETADPEADTGPLPTIPAITVEDEDEPLLTPVVTAVSAASPDNDVVAEDSEETADLHTEAAPWLSPEPAPDIREEQAAVPPAGTAADKKAAQRRGQRAALMGAIGGVLGGVLLTLLILFLINGSLNYAAQSRALQQQIIEAQATQSALDRELNALATALDGNIGSLNQRLDTADSRLNQTNDNLASLGGDLSQTQTDIDTLYETSEELDERLEGVAAAAVTFNNFLNGLRDLLFDIQGPLPVVTATATVTPTVPTVTGTFTPTPDTEVDSDDENDEAEAEENELEPLVTPTAPPLPTRTPRPTATPIGAPTATPTP
jgi:competence ComEA-like helix-hairpin-helix protein